MANHSNPGWLQRHLRQIVVVLLAGILCVTALGIVARLGAQRIARNEQQWLAAQIDAMIPASLHDNDLLSDVTRVVSAEALGTRNPVAVYRARLNNRPTALIINSVAPDGYGGPIELLIAINLDGVVLSVRVVKHHETPGMGDAFAQTASRWLDAFRGRSVRDPDTRGWNVHKDGGEFEQFTSATISPRAIIHAVQRTLDYYQRHQTQLFQLPADSAAHSTDATALNSLPVP